VRKILLPLEYVLLQQLFVGFAQLKVLAYAAAIDEVFEEPAA